MIEEVISKQRQSDVLKFLAGIDLFKNFNESALSDLMKSMNLVYLKAGEIFIRQGDYGTSLYILMQGKLKIFINKEAQENNLQNLAAVGDVSVGEIIGEMAVLTNQPRTSTVCAIEESTLLELDKEAFQELKKRHPEEVNAIATTAINRFKSLTDQLVDANRLLTQKQTILDEDLKAAAFIQQSLLPPESLQLPNLKMAWAYLPCNPVGGDLFNIVKLNDNKIIFYVLDVSGHDIPSAMVTVSIAQFLQQHNLPSEPLLTPKEILVALEKEYSYERFERYFTIFYMVLDLHTGKLIYSTAGHPPGILLRSNQKFELLEGKRAMIGFSDDDVFDDKEILLEKGNKLIFYTDGITEFYQSSSDLFGSKQLYALLEKHKNEPVQVLKDTILQTLKEFGKDAAQHDDISLICFEYV